MKEVTPNFEMAMWNGLFVHQDTPADVRAKISAVAMKTMASERAQDLTKQTGGFVYWKDAKASQVQIEPDTAVIGRIAETLKK